MIFADVKIGDIFFEGIVSGEYHLKIDDTTSVVIDPDIDNPANSKRYDTYNFPANHEVEEPEDF